MLIPVNDQLCIWDIYLIFLIFRVAAYRKLILVNKYYDVIIVIVGSTYDIVIVALSEKVNIFDCLLFN